MSVHINFHRLDPATVTHYPQVAPVGPVGPAFITINAKDNHHGSVSLYFLADDHLEGELVAAESWLLDALGKVVDAKIAAANAQQESLPVVQVGMGGAFLPAARIGEPLDLTAVDL